MVSFWPWRGDETSPASFEKTLSILSAKITKTGTRLDGLRQRARRLSALWTLYSVFAYLLCTIILLLVVGWQNWGVTEYTAIAAGPLVIYLVRLGLKTYYDYRTSTYQAQLESQQKQRDGTIEKLKTATKYNSTQELLKKYGGTPTPKTKPSDGQNEKGTPKRSSNAGTPQNRTTFVPPPTANIPGRQLPPSQPISQPRIAPHNLERSPTMTANRPQSLLSPQESSGDFAPNAFPSAPQYAPTIEGSRWYDRIVDVLLGEDESLPGKRLALICSQCRLVNGQAPPGVKRLEDVGKWRCGGCGAMNGEESQVQSIIQSVRGQTSSESRKPKRDRESEASLDEEKMKEEVGSQSDGRDEQGSSAEFTSDASDSDSSVMMKEVAKQKKEVEPQGARRRSTRAKRNNKQAS